MRIVSVLTHTNRISGAERVLAHMFSAVNTPVHFYVGSKYVQNWFEGKGLKTNLVDGFQPITTTRGVFEFLRRWLKAFCLLRFSLKDEDILYLHTTNPVGLLFSIALRLTGLNVAIVLHCHDYYSSRNSIVRFFLKLSMHCVDFSLVVSRDVQRSLRAAGYTLKQSCVLYNGVASDLKPVNKDPELFIVCGYFEPWKGLHVVVEAFLLAKSRGRLSKGVRLQIIGAIPDAEYRSKIQNLISADDSLFILTGEVRNAAEHFSRATYFVHFPIEADPFPTVILEAMAAGCFCIISSRGGGKEALGPSSGIVVYENQVSSLSDAIINAVERIQLRPSEHYRQHWENHFTTEAVGRRYKAWLLSTGLSSFLLL